MPYRFFLCFGLLHELRLLAGSKILEVAVEELKHSSSSSYELYQDASSAQYCDESGLWAFEDGGSESDLSVTIEDAFVAVCSLERGSLQTILSDQNFPSYLAKMKFCCALLDVIVQEICYSQSIQLDSLELALDEFGASIYSETQHLLVALQTERFDVLRTLLTRGIPKTGDSVALALALPNAEATGVLLEHGLEPFFERDGKTLLMSVVTKSGPVLEVVKELLKLGVDANHSPSSDSIKVLELAATQPSIDLILLLTLMLDAKADGPFQDRHAATICVSLLQAFEAFKMHYLMRKDAGSPYSCFCQEVHNHIVTFILGD